MKRIYITFSLRDAREGYSRINNDIDLAPATSDWSAGNEWMSVGFDTDDEEDEELMDNTIDELKANLKGLEYELSVKKDVEL